MSKYSISFSVGFFCFLFSVDFGYKDYDVCNSNMKKNKRSTSIDCIFNFFNREKSFTESIPEEKKYGKRRSSLTDIFKPVRRKLNMFHNLSKSKRSNENLNESKRDLANRYNVIEKSKRSDDNLNESKMDLGNRDNFIEKSKRSDDNLDESKKNLINLQVAIENSVNISSKNSYTKYIRSEKLNPKLECNMTATPVSDSTSKLYKPILGALSTKIPKAERNKIREQLISQIANKYRNKDNSIVLDTGSQIGGVNFLSLWRGADGSVTNCCELAISVSFSKKSLKNKLKITNFTKIKNINADKID